MSTNETFTPLHPARLWHPLERALREEWESITPRNQGIILAGPECQYPEIPKGVEFEANKLTGGYQPYPYGRMTARDRMVASEVIQWLGTGIGFNFLARAFRKAGGRVELDDYAPALSTPECDTLDEQLRNDGFTQPGHEIDLWRKLALKLEAKVIRLEKLVDEPEDQIVNGEEE